MIGSVVPDDMNEAFVGVARLDLGEKLRDDMGPDRRCGAAEASLQPFAQFCLLAQMSFETAPFPAINGQRIPASLVLALVPAPNAVAIKVENLGNGLA